VDDEFFMLPPFPEADPEAHLTVAPRPLSSLYTILSSQIPPAEKEVHPFV